MAWALHQAGIDSLLITAMFIENPVAQKALIYKPFIEKMGGYW
jgi:hypothetical protein